MARGAVYPWHPKGTPLQVDYRTDAAPAVGAEGRDAATADQRSRALGRHESARVSVAKVVACSYVLRTTWHTSIERLRQPEQLALSMIPGADCEDDALSQVDVVILERLQPTAARPPPVLLRPRERSLAQLKAVALHGGEDRRKGCGGPLFEARVSEKRVRGFCDGSPHPFYFGARIWLGAPCRWGFRGALSKDPVE